MSALVYADQSAAALKLTLIEGAFDPTQFQVLDRMRIAAGEFEVDAGIIGQSHYLAVRGERVAFAEVVACGPVEAARVHRCRKLPPLRGTLSTGPVGGVTDYRLRVDRRSAARGRPLTNRTEAAARSAAASGRGIGLTRRFPVGPDGAEARTILLVHSDAGRLDVRTVHVYPNEQTSVFTHSIIRLL